jgi:parallel beta-helix repeat protein
VTVKNGTIEGFDAGVYVNEGSGNTITHITAINNVNDMDEPFTFVPGQGTLQQPDVVSGAVTPQEWNRLMLCDLGDGIILFASDDNVIEHNEVIGNGPYSGISLVDDSDNNVVRHNTVLDNNIPNVTTQNTPSGPEEGAGLCGATLPGAPGMQRGREIQDIGIRIEGPNANDNLIEHNRVENSALVGISIHSYVCNPAPGEPRVGQEPNTGNVISKNDVSRTGEETVEMDPFADGIAVLAQGPIGIVTCASPGNTIVGNRSHDNMRHGISLGTTVEDTTVDGNQVRNNAVDGIRVYNRAVNNTIVNNIGMNNGEHDGHDDNTNCDNNQWSGNKFFSVNQPCVGGTLGRGRGNGPSNETGVVELSNSGRGQARGR